MVPANRHSWPGWLLPLSQLNAKAGLGEWREELPAPGVDDGLFDQRPIQPVSDALSNGRARDHNRDVVNGGNVGRSQTIVHEPHPRAHLFPNSTARGKHYVDRPRIDISQFPEANSSFTTDDGAFPSPQHRLLIFISRSRRDGHQAVEAPPSMLKPPLGGELA